MRNIYLRHAESGYKGHHKLQLGRPAVLSCSLDNINIADSPKRTDALEKLEVWSTLSLSILDPTLDDDLDHDACKPRVQNF